MTHHPSTSQLERFCAGALPDDELTAVATHLADCPSCHDLFVGELRSKTGAGPFTFTLAPEFWFRHDHLDFDLLSDLADEKLDQCKQEIIDAHLTTCETCREDVRSFLAFRKAETRATEERGTEAE